VTFPLRAAILACVLVLGVAACGGGDDDASAADTTAAEPPDTSTPDTTEPADTTAPPETTAAPDSSASADNSDDVADPGETVAVHYTGTLDDGEEFDSSREREPLEFVIGSGQVIAGFDSAVTGLTVGESVTVSIPPEDAYGLSDPEAIIPFPIEEVPEEFRIEGVQVMLGNGIPATVIEVTEDTVTIDANHPLAGQTLTFEIELVEIKG
jgi:peptidylprolyl isomerase